MIFRTAILAGAIVPATKCPLGFLNVNGRAVLANSLIFGSPDGSTFAARDKGSIGYSEPSSKFGQVRCQRPTPRGAVLRMALETVEGPDSFGTVDGSHRVHYPVRLEFRNLRTGEFAVAGVEIP
jgi:hypothetical protein